MFNVWVQVVLRVQGGEKVYYGVIFVVQGQEEDLRLLDDLLEFYSFFFFLLFVYGDNQKEIVERYFVFKDDFVVDIRGVMVVLVLVVIGNGKQVYKYLFFQVCIKLWDLNNF